MNRAFIKYYIDSTRYNFAFSTLFFLVVSPLAGIVSMSTFGFGLGILCFKQFHGYQYYFYYNLGMTKQKLMLNTLIINSIITIPLLLLFL